MSDTISQRLLPGAPVVESPLFSASLDEMKLTDAERRIALALHTDGFAVFDFPDADLDGRAARIVEDLTPQYDFAKWRKEGWPANQGLRLQDAWRNNADVRAIACNERLIALLSKLYGRRAFPFQSLNFAVGTQQHYHSDSVHFSSIPERFMCGVWLALEDIDPAAGPLIYYPGSHRWPILYNDLIGRVAGDRSGDGVFAAQAPYERAWQAMVEATHTQPATFLPKKGQALIWAANLLHGGARQTDPSRTRWSQVTHYYFEGCSYYTPAFSDPLAGNLDLRSVTDISTGAAMPNVYIDRPIGQVSGAVVAPERDNSLPADFDAARYLALNPDVSMAGLDAAQHYVAHGHAEKRRYR